MLIIKVTQRLFLMSQVSDYKMALNFEADIINGPTRGTGLPPFSWTSEFNQTHMGLPTTYNFDFLRTSPKFKTPWKGQQAAKRNFKHSAWIYQINSAMMILNKHVLLILLRKSIVFSVAFNHWCIFEISIVPVNWCPCKLLCLYAVDINNGHVLMYIRFTCTYSVCWFQ